MSLLHLSRCLDSHLPHTSFDVSRCGKLTDEAVKAVAEQCPREQLDGERVGHSLIAALGGRKADCGPYCAEHAKVAFQPARKRDSKRGEYDYVRRIAG